MFWIVVHCTKRFYSTLWWCKLLTRQTRCWKICPIQLKLIIFLIFWFISQKIIYIYYHYWVIWVKLYGSNLVTDAVDSKRQKKPKLFVLPFWRTEEQPQKKKKNLASFFFFLNYTKRATVFFVDALNLPQSNYSHMIIPIWRDKKLKEKSIFFFFNCIISRSGVAGAVLQTPRLLTWLTD